jgi:hypothetical protein
LLDAMRSIEFYQAEPQDVTWSSEERKLLALF